MRLTKLFLGLSLSILTVIGLAGCNNGDEGLAGGPPELAEEVVELIVTPKNSSIPIGFSQTLKAEVLLSEGQVIDVTKREEVVWESSDESIATIDTNGLATGKAEGTVIITISGQSNGQAFSDTAELVVTNGTITSLEVTPKDDSLPIGLTKSFTAIAYLSDGTNINVTEDEAIHWSSDDETVATISNTADEKGVALGKTTGVTVITASGLANGVSFEGTAELEVVNATITSLEVTPKDDSLPIGLTKSFTAIAYLSDGTNINVTQDEALSWKSSDTNIATVDTGTGIATGVNEGTVTITASGRANGIRFSDSSELNITNAVVTELEVTPETEMVIVGAELIYTAIATLSDGSELDVTRESALHWKSSNPNIATIGSSGDHKGVAKGEAVGTVTITASGSSNGVDFEDMAELVVKTNRVVTWGHQTYGGDSSEVQDELINIATISGSYYALAAIKTDGSVITWGHQAYGGDSSEVQDELINVTSITGNNMAFAAIKTDGSVVTWGDSRYGGDNSSVDSLLVDVVSISGTSNAFAAIKADGSVVTWGEADTGGDSSLVQDELVSVTSITGTARAFAAIKADGSVVTWGSSAYGGDSSAVQDDLVNIMSITASDSNFAALKEGDGSVVYWGGGSGNDSYPPESLRNVTSISATERSFAAIREGGGVVAWGFPDYGGDTSDVETDLISDVTSITGNRGSFAAIKANGSVVTWGDLDPTNSGGGNSSSVQDMLFDVTSITGTDLAFSAIKDDGHAVTWGRDTLGGDSSDVQDELVSVISISASSGGAFAAIVLNE